MNSILRFGFCLLIFLLIAGAWPFLAPHATAQDDIHFSASVDRTALSTDEVLTLEVVLSGSFKTSGQPQLLPLDDFSVVSASQSTQFSIVNSQYSSKVVFTYRLRPLKTGDLAIPAISVQVSGNTYYTNPIAIKVTGGSALPTTAPGDQTPQATKVPEELAGQDFYVEAEVDNPSPVAGQQIVYKFRFYQAVNVFRQPSLLWPDFTGFLHYNLSPDNQYHHQAGGQQYLVTEVRRALFPTTQGELNIEPAALTVPGGLFNRDVYLQTKSVPVNVSPLPQGAPADFAGSVGQYKIDASVEPVESRVNEPVVLKIRISGAGNVNLLPDPTKKITDELSTEWRVYNPQVTTNMGQSGDVIRGEKVFEFPLFPKTEGDLAIPPITFSYYDPEAKAYRQVITDPISVNVAPGDPESTDNAGGGKQDIVVKGGDIRHIKPAPTGVIISHPSILSQPLYWIGWAIGPIAALGLWQWHRRRSYLEDNIAYARSRRAYRSTRKKLARARKIGETDPLATYAAVSKAITSYLGDKFNMPVAGLTRDVIRQTMASRALPDEEIDRTLFYLEWADSGRFAPAASGEDAEALMEGADSLIKDLENMMAREII